MTTDGSSADDELARLVRRLLESEIVSLERKAIQGHYHTIGIRSLGEVARVLGHEGIAGRALQLLSAAPDEKYWEGMITNIELPAKVPEKLRTFGSAAELQDRFPKYREDVTLAYIRSCAASEPHLACCLEGRVHDAIAIAQNGLKLQEVGLTLAVLGKFEDAMGVARSEALEPSRQRGIAFVMTIELFRRGQSDKARALLAEFGADEFGIASRDQMALGLGGREPWGGYPFPDW